MTERRFMVATEAAEADLRRHAAEGGDILVTKDSHPLMFECLEDISHDCGAGAGHSNYSIPREWESYLAHEAALAELSDEERSTLCIGEVSEADEIASRNCQLSRVHHFLSAFFDDFEGDLCPEDLA